MFDYIGNPLQTRGAEEYTLSGGKGNGMRFLYVRNGLGLEAWVSLSRAADLSRVIFKGDNIGYFSPVGYVAPEFYDCRGDGFLKSFTAGFLTTCGLTAVGTPCVDDGEELPLHGTISNTPVSAYSAEEKSDGLHIKAVIEDCRIFARKLVLTREYVFSYSENSIRLCDKVTNYGDNESPYMLLYHCNVGYPLLTEKTKIVIPNTGVTPRNEYADKYLNTALKTEGPQPCYTERCYYYDVLQNDGICKVGAFNESISKGLVLCYNKKELPCFTQWKMMGKHDYVLGLEPGNCTPDGRDVLRKNGTLEFLQPEETGKTSIRFIFKDNKNQFAKEF